MTYHIARNNQQLGSCSKEEAAARYARGELLPTDLVWCEGMTDWVPASSVFGSPAPTPAPTPAPSPAATPPSPPPAPPPASFTAPQQAQAGAKPDNWLVWSILSTVLCCLPIGIVAIIFATQVDSKWNRGDYEGARKAAGNAKMWTLISAGVGIVVSLAYVALMVIGAASGGAYNY